LPWREVCTAFLKKHGAVFDVLWDGNLSEIRTKFTSANGAAIATFFVREHVTASVLLLRARSPTIEKQLTEMFVDSLRRTTWVVQAATTPFPFSTAGSIIDRPLLLVVAFPEPSVSEHEQSITRELVLHLAGAFFDDRSSADEN
ncbi:MAG: hypothetical protein JSS02_00510, partial [Planctomycetes bacterium]|nr:hypothetical protein [Planctomycetota bacterium]